ncbi:molybdate ABC transporter substrate-binding protein [soil metagenome]
MAILRVLAAIVLCLGWATGVVASPASPGVAQTSAPLTVFAAASLKESLDAAAADWSARSGQRVVVSYAASSALARQIERGAPADIFISADADWMDYLAQRNAVDAASRFDLAGNTLVLVAPTAGGATQVALDAASLTRALDAGGKGARMAVAEMSGVPAGRYAKQSLQALGLWTTVSDHLAPADNVRAVLAFVARGEAPLGIVYVTDARAEPRVQVVAHFPDNSHARIVYPAARVAAAPAERSAGFLAYLRSQRARAIFLRFGFSAP